MFVPAKVISEIHTARGDLSLAETYGPHVDKAAAEERVQIPVYAGQAGDVKHFMT